MMSDTAKKEKKIKICGLTVYRKVYFSDVKKTYILGIKIHTKKRKMHIESVFQKTDNVICLEDADFNVAFFLTGGLGDYIIAGAYIKEFCKRFNIKADIISRMPKSLTEDLFYKQSFWRNIYEVKTKLPDNDINKYDLYIRLSRFPEIVHINQNKINDKNLQKYLELLLIFYNENEKFYVNHPHCDGLAAQYCIVNGIHRYNQADINAEFGLDASSLCYLNTEGNEENFLKTWGLETNKYITLQRGCDANKDKESTKLWPTENYNTLILLLKKSFPHHKIVQIGLSNEKCELLENIDLCLVGKTTLDDLKIVLKNSYLHIDSEGGNVHLRHALKGGKSVVIFGPTSKDFYGYPENINIQNSACPVWCEWIKNDWSTQCLNQSNTLICVKSIKAEQVMNEKKKNIND